MNLKNKITFVNSTLSGGGSEAVCVNIANAFANKGWKVDLVILNLKEEAYKYRLSSKVKLVELNVNHARNSSYSLIKYIYKYKPKIIFVFNYELSIMLLILRFLLRFKFRIIARNINTLSIKIRVLKEENFWNKYVVSNLIKYFYNKLDHIVNQCNAMRDDLIGIYPKLLNSCSVVYNPLSPEYENYSKKNNINNIKKKDYLLCVGRLEKQKAFHFAIESFAKIQSKFPNLRLKIIGKGSLEKDLKKKAKDLSILNKVDFLGFQKDLIPYYLYSKATILTSHYEGYPNVLIESIAMNTPVVSFDCASGPSEIIKDGINGYLVKYMDFNDLKNKLIKTITTEFNYNDLNNSIKKNKIENVFQHYEKIILQFY